MKKNTSSIKFLSSCHSTYIRRYKKEKKRKEKIIKINNQLKKLVTFTFKQFFFCNLILLYGIRKETNHFLFSY